MADENPDAIEQQLSRRRTAVAGAWNLSDTIVLVAAGDPIPIPGRGDPTYPFIAHAEYLYLTDRNQPGEVLAYDPREGWVDFVAPITEADRLWSGAPAEDPVGPTTASLAGWLEERRGQPVARLGAVAAGPDADSGVDEELRFALSRVRRIKDAVELERMRIAERATSAGFAAAVPLLREGVTEREVQIELETAALRSGGDAMAYDTIVGSGPNSGVLHFLPTRRRMSAGELVLIDAGAEYRGYASDITRTYPVGGRLGAEQRELHAVVHAAERASITRCLAGTEWREVHLTAALTIAEGLIGCGYLNGTPESLVESGAVGLFFPHGVGHLVGLGVRDAGGILAERRGQPPPFPNLRIDLPLEPGMVVTVEPGVYFVPAILRDPERRQRYRDAVAWDRVEPMLGFGGIRIEDNVLITDDGHEVMTSDVPVLG
jgi:Xaa-Pro aminopeptidase